MMQTIQLWLSLVLNLSVAGIAVLVISLAVAFRSSTTGGQIGVALNVVMTISSTLVRLLEQWTQLETSLGAVSRIKSLEATLVPEDKEAENFDPPEDWPNKGAIEFRGVTAAYKYVVIYLHSTFSQADNEAKSRVGRSKRNYPQYFTRPEGWYLRSHWKVCG